MTINAINDVETNFNLLAEQPIDNVPSEQDKNVDKTANALLKHGSVGHAYTRLALMKENSNGKKILDLTNQSKNILNEIQALNQLEIELEAIADSDKGVKISESLKEKLSKFGFNEKETHLTKLKKESLKSQITKQRDQLKLDFQAPQPHLQKLLYEIQTIHNCALEAIRAEKRANEKALEIPR